MQHQRFLPWLMSFSRDWIAPKIGVALGVSAVSAVLFSMDGSSFTGAAQERFNRIFELTNSHWVLVALGCIAPGLLIALYARHFFKGRSRSLYYFERSLSRLSLAINTVLGLLLVPLIVSITALSLLPGVQQVQLGSFYFIAVSFVIVSAAFHFMGGQDGEPRHVISYTISTGNTAVASEQFHHGTAGRLAEVMSHVLWHEGPSEACETTDGHIVLIMPFYLHLSSWNPKEIEALSRFVNAIELEWRTVGYIAKRTISPEISAALPE